MAAFSFAPSSKFSYPATRIIRGQQQKAKRELQKQKRKTAARETRHESLAGRPGVG